MPNAQLKLQTKYSLNIGLFKRIIKVQFLQFDIFKMKNIDFPTIFLPNAHFIFQKVPVYRNTMYMYIYCSQYILKIYTPFFYNWGSGILKTYVNCFGGNLRNCLKQDKMI